VWCRRGRACAGAANGSADDGDACIRLALLPFGARFIGISLAKRAMNGRPIAVEQPLDPTP